MNPIEAAALKIIVAHEDSLTGIRAVGLLNKLAAHLENHLGLAGCPLQVESNNLWNFECLRDLDLRAEALSASADADIILISAGSQTQLPAWVKTWIEGVLGRTQRRPSAMVAMFNGRPEPSATSLRPAAYLRQLAELHGVDFFCNLDLRTAPITTDRQAAFPSGFEHDSGFSSDGSSDDFKIRRWGTNE